MRFILRAVLIFIFLIPIIACDNNNNNPEVSENVVHPEWSYNKTIYEVNVRQYTEEGTFSAFAEHLPRLKEMGVGIIWFMPIHPIGEANRKGTLGSYYSVKDFKKVNPEFGTLQDFKNVVEQIHNMGMYVIIDWVANHSAWDNPLTQTNPEFYTTDSTGNFVPPVADWEDVIDFNYDQRGLWDYMIGALKYWVDECNIDGYRCDVAAMVPTEFWNEARGELNKSKDVFMLAEATEVELHEKAFDMTYNWQLKDLMNQVADTRSNAVDIKNYFENEKIEYPADAFRMVFTTNHDENSWNGTVYERLGDGVEAFAVLCGTVRGMPLVYSGQEAGLSKRLKFFDKDVIEWKENNLFNIYKKLFDLKKVNKALWNGKEGGEISVLQVTGSENVFAFVREKENNKIFVIINMSNGVKSVNINNDLITGNYIDLFQNQNISIDSTATFSLQPWEYHVFVK